MRSGEDVQGVKCTFDDRPLIKFNFYFKETIGFYRALLQNQIKVENLMFFIGLQKQIVPIEIFF